MNTFNLIVSIGFFTIKLVTVLASSVIVYICLLSIIYIIYIRLNYKVWFILPSVIKKSILDKKFKWVVYGVCKKYYDRRCDVQSYRIERKRFVFIDEKSAIKELKKIRNKLKLNSEIFVLNLTFEKEEEELNELFPIFPYPSLIHDESIFYNENSINLNKALFNI